MQNLPTKSYCILLPLKSPHFTLKKLSPIMSRHISDSLLRTLPTWIFQNSKPKPMLPSSSPLSTETMNYLNCLKKLPPDCIIKLCSTSKETIHSNSHPTMITSRSKKNKKNTKSLSLSDAKCTCASNQKFTSLPFRNSTLSSPSQFNNFLPKLCLTLL